MFKDFFADNRVRFAIYALLYLLFVIWVGNYFLLFGLLVIFDIFISQKVNWTFWRKEDGSMSKPVQWTEDILFAVIGVALINIYIFQNYKIPTGSMENSLLIGDHLYVSKIAYGPKIPNTPLSFPFAQNTMPLVGGKSYIEAWQRPYKRLAGLSTVKRNDVVVFNCPVLDSVTAQNPTFSYNSDLWRLAEQIRYRELSEGQQVKGDGYYIDIARQYLENQTDLLTRPVDRRDNYIKRCVGIPGDSLQVINTVLYINGEKEAPAPGQLKEHRFRTTQPLSDRFLKKQGIARRHIRRSGTNVYTANLSIDQIESLKKLNVLDTIIPVLRESNEYFSQTYPNSPNYNWSIDNFGPIWIPKKGETIQLTTENLPIYQRIINAYEENDLLVKDGEIFINGEHATTYTFKMDYYFMMGDNRHGSWDSRSWGYVPEDHIVGKPRFVWLSLDSEESFPKNIRFDRFFKIIR